MKRFAFLTICTLMISACAHAAPQNRLPMRPQGLPSSTLPDGLGVNIHFTDARPGELEQLQAGGFSWIRNDFAWSETEKTRGQYDFSAYERQLDAMEAKNIRVLFILDYGNPLYAEAGQGFSWTPRTPEARQAMARWAVAAVKRFQNRGVIWEMWNEPNISGFWKPAPNVQEYIALAKEVCGAIRAATPNETLVGPGTSGVDLPFLEACAKSGLLELWDAVSVHPYRQDGPESSAEELRALRQVIARYAPKGKPVPILSSEWGYSSAWPSTSEDEQGKRLARQWLTNISNGVPLSIWYDWHDDGVDPKEPEHHFGTVRNEYREAQTPVYEPKPAYRAAQTLARFFKGYTFNKRLWTGREDDHVLLFSRAVNNQIQVKLAAWTRAPSSHAVSIPAFATTFDAQNHLGEVSTLKLGAGSSLMLTTVPQYLTPRGHDDALQVAAAWQRAPLELFARGPQSVALALPMRNPLTKPIRVVNRAKLQTLAPKQTFAPRGTISLSRDPNVPAQIISRTVEINGQRATMSQRVPIIVTNPLRLTLLPVGADKLALRVENPSGESTSGRFVLSFGPAGMTQLESSLSLKNSETEKSFAVGSNDLFAKEHLRASVNNVITATFLTDTRRVLASTLPTRFVSLPNFSALNTATLPQSYNLIPDGDPKIASTQTLAPATNAPDLPDDLGGVGGALQLDYEFAQGWKFVRIAPFAPMKINGRPRALGTWVYGDDSNNLLRLRFSDESGQTFQPDGVRLDFSGWRYLTLPLDGTSSAFWGGKNDGILHGALTLDTLFLLDGLGAATKGRVLFASPTLVY